MKQRDQDIIRMYREGWSLKEVGLVYGLRKQGVAYILEREGFPRRESGKWHKSKRMLAPPTVQWYGKFSVE